MQIVSRLNLATIEKKLPSYIGYVYAVLSNSIFVLGHYFVQKISKRFSADQVLFYVGVQLFLYNYATVKAQKISCCPKIPHTTRMLLLRAIFGFVAGIFFYRGLPMVPLSEGIVVQMLTPVITGILAIMLLREKYDMTLLITTILSVTGVLLITKPDFIFGEETQQTNEYPQRTFGLFLLLLCSFLASFSQILIKKLGSVSNAYNTGMYLGLGFALSSAVCQITKGVDVGNASIYIWLAVIGLSRYLAHVLLNKSYAFGDAGKIALFAYLQVPFGYIIDIFIVGRSPDFYSGLGSVSIFSSVFVTLYKQYQTKKVGGGTK